MKPPCIDGTMAHRWDIPTPDGRAMLPSRCLRCEQTYEFSAAGEESDAGFNGNISMFANGEKELIVR